VEVDRGHVGVFFDVAWRAVGIEHAMPSYDCFRMDAGLGEPSRSPSVVRWELPR
jgi:hypothetical protein